MFRKHHQEWLRPLLLFAVAALVPAVAAEEAAPDRIPLDQTAESPLPARYARKFSLNEPMYFAVGWRGSTNARFQLSFRYRFIGSREDEPLPAGERQFYFAYTQTSFWDIDSESAPFRDTAYRPSLVLDWPRLSRPRFGSRSSGIKVGLEHESNGRDGEFSRSLNTVFVRPRLVWGDPQGYVLTFAPKFWIYIGDLSDNPDIEDFRGYGEFLLKWEKADSWGISATLRKGVAGSRGSVLVDASYPLDRLLRGHFDSYAHLQYFNGWGESLLDYDLRQPAQLRLGLMIVR